MIRDRAGDHALVELVAHECAARGFVPIIEHVSNAELRRQTALRPEFRNDGWTFLLDRNRFRRMP